LAVVVVVGRGQFVGEHGQGEDAGERGGGLQRAAQVARVQRADGVAAEARRRFRRLAQAAAVSSALSLWPWARPSVFQVLSPCLTRWRSNMSGRLASVC
jgi:hypothetical protein